MAEDVLQQFAAENLLVGGVAYIKARRLKNNTSHQSCLSKFIKSARQMNIPPVNFWFQSSQAKKW